MEAKTLIFMGIEKELLTSKSRWFEGRVLTDDNANSNFTVGDRDSITLDGYVKLP